MNINEILSTEFNLKLEQINSVTDLLDEGNTIPFIARYRKEVTGSFILLPVSTKALISTSLNFNI